MRKAFSLVELSIVLIIIGLLVAGVTSGSKLIKQAKINRVIAEVNDIISSAKVFQATYGQLPGDFDDATSFWSVYNSSSNPTGTVDGDGNGEITYTTEGRRFYHHMSLAEVYTGSYSSGTTASWVAGTNVKASSYDPGVYGIYSPTLNGEAKANYFRLGQASGAGNNVGVVDVIFAYGIDRKMDDGEPSRGRVRVNSTGYSNDAVKPNGTVCVNGNFTEVDLSYVFSSTDKCMVDLAL